MNQHINQPDLNESKEIKHFVIKAFLFVLVFIGLDLLLPHIFIPDANDQLFYITQNSLGWMGTPNFEGVLDGPEFKQKVTFNSLGMHDTDHSPEKPPNTVRILMMGDSFVQAVHVAETETAHQVLEDTLNLQANESTTFEVISSGVINWGTNQQLLFYQEQGRQFEPDVVLLMLSISSDFQDNLPGNVLTAQGINAYAPYFSLCQNKLLPEPLTYAPGFSNPPDNCSAIQRSFINLMGTLYQHSLLYQKLERSVLSNQPRLLFGQDYALPYSALYLPNNEPELEKAWQVTLAAITQFRREVEADGHKFAVAIVSPGVVMQLSMLLPDQKEQYLKDNPVLINAQADRPNQRLAQFFNQQDISFIDLTGPMVNHWSQHGVPLYFFSNGHWTVEGHRVVGDILTQWLTDNEFIQP